jgi:hypothetical protein
LIEQFLARLEGVKRGSNKNSWLAKCPSHEDRMPSLSVTYADDGRILVKCFAGCDVSHVVGAVGMDLSDLFPPTERDYTRPKSSIKLRISAMDLLEAIHFEALVVLVAASTMAKGAPLAEDDQIRLRLAASRIDEALRRAKGE